MSDPIVMPNLGFDSQESRLVEWLKQPGDSVERGEPVAIIESDKAEIELESTAKGTLLEQVYAEDSMVPIGATIAFVGQAADSQPKTTQSTPPAKNIDTKPEKDKPLASPIAKRLAREHGIELAGISGSGARGRITREDVEAHVSEQSNGGGGILALPKVRKAARDAGINLYNISPSDPRGIIHIEDLPLIQAEPASATSNDERQHINLSRLRRRVGERMVASKREAPHFYVSGEFDFEYALVTLRDRNAKVNDLIQYLTVRTLMQVPDLNATYEDGNLYHYQPINLAMAVALDDGLIAPVIHDAGRFSLEGLAQESRALIKRARSNSLRPDDLSGGTFTISNLGVIKQVDDFVAVINPPQVGILAVGTLKQRPIVLDGGLHLRHTVKLTLSGDHRAVDGMHLARFLQAFQDELNKFSGGKS